MVIVNIERVHAFEQRLAGGIETLLPQASNKPPPLSGALLIYGAGKKGQQIGGMLQRAGFDVVGFADASPLAKQLISLPVRTLNEWREHCDTSRLTVVVAIHNYRASVAAILRQLEKTGFSRIVSPVEIHSMFPDTLADHYWLTGTANYAARFQRIPALAKHLTDSSSQSLLEDIVRFRLTGGYSALPQPDATRQYCPADIPPWPEPVRLVDCGAFDGDTLRSFLSAGILLESAIAFEPDPNNFAALTSFIGRTTGLPPVICIPAGVGERTGICRFDSDDGAASRISDEGECSIQIIALDEALGSYAPTLIKMDVEGAELEALRGARKLLHRHRPALAISLYHRPNVLWDIPDFLISLDLGYDLYLRCHGENSFDLVLYAIPSRIL